MNYILDLRCRAGNRHIEPNDLSFGFFCKLSDQLIRK